MKPKIIVIEEVTIIRAFICEMLNRQGYDAVGVKNGKGAVDSLRKNGTSGLILTDYNLPDTTGDVFLKQIRGSTQETIPVIFLTAESDPEKIQHAKESALVAWVQKPYRIETLLKQVREAVDGEFIH